MVVPGAPRIELLEKSELLECFVCGEAPELEEFLRQHALRNQVEGFGRTYVVRGELAGQEAILGYYTLAPTSVGREVVPRKRRHGTPKEIPVILIGRLAVDDRVRGQRLGEALLFDALERIFDSAKTIGCYAAVVDARDKKAEGFYRHYEFELMDEQALAYPRRMFLRVSTIAQLLAED